MKPEIKSIAPGGFRELRPGKSLAIAGGKVFSCAQFTLIGDEWKRAKLKNSLVPDTVAKMVGPKDEQEFNAWCEKMFLPDPKPEPLKQNKNKK